MTTVLLTVALISQVKDRHLLRLGEPYIGMRGDTGLDVRAGLDSGARVIAVATGTDTAQDLAAAGAGAVLSEELRKHVLTDLRPERQVRDEPHVEGVLRVRAWRRPGHRILRRSSG